MAEGGVVDRRTFQDSYAQVFHGDATGDLNEAQKEMMLAHTVLKDQAKEGDGTNSIFWLDPMSKDGLRIGAQVLPYAHDLAAACGARADSDCAGAGGCACAGACSDGPEAYDPADTYPSRVRRRCGRRRRSMRWNWGRGGWT